MKGFSLAINVKETTSGRQTNVLCLRDNKMPKELLDSFQVVQHYCSPFQRNAFVINSLLFMIKQVRRFKNVQT